jgi:TetR/AcrR family transcriptional regulator
MPEPSDVRSRTLATATRLFAAHGFEGTSLQAIADGVGVSKPAVLHHFSSKEELRRAVFEEILAHWQETLPRLLIAATASEDRFDAVFGELRRFFAADPDRARLVVREAFDRPAEVKRLLRGPVRTWLGAVAGYIRSGQAHGHHWADVDPEAYVVLMMNFVVAATAAANVFVAAIDDSGTEAHARVERELGRIAKASLFRPLSDEADNARSRQPDQETGSEPAPRTRPSPGRKRTAQR